jgi:hypothetical protein
MRIQIAAFFPRFPDSSEDFNAECLATTLEQLASKVREVGAQEGLELKKFTSGVAYRVPHDEKTAEIRIRAIFEGSGEEKDSRVRVTIERV